MRKRLTNLYIKTTVVLGLVSAVITIIVFLSGKSRARDFLQNESVPTIKQDSLGNQNPLVETWKFSVNDKVESIGFSPDGKVLAIVTDQNTIEIWDAMTGRKLHHLQSWSKIKCLKFSPNSQIIASGHTDKKIRLWNLRTGELAYILEGHKSTVSAIAFSKDGNKLFSGGATQDGSLKCWDVRAGQLVYSTGRISEYIKSIALSNDEETIACGGGYNGINLLDINGNHLEVLYDVKDSWPIKHILFSDNDSSLVEISDMKDGVRKWDVRQKKILFEKRCPFYDPEISSDATGNLVILKDQNLNHCTDSKNADFWFWRSETNYFVEKMKGTEAVVSSNGQIILVSSINKELVIRKSNRSFVIQNAHQGIIGYLAISNDNELAASYSCDGIVKIWSITESNL